MALTALMMLAEIVVGWLYNSMALLADGWHMSSHALAFGLSVLACGTARRFAHDTRFAFGTWKIEVLGGYALVWSFKDAEDILPAAGSPTLKWSAARGLVNLSSTSTQTRVSRAECLFWRGFAPV